jgi:hypothetical protein
MPSRLFSGRRQSVRMGAAGLLLLSFPVLAGCSGSLLGSSPSAPDSGDSGTSSSLTDKFTSFFIGGQSKTATQGVAGPATDIDCPVMDVRNGASTLSVNADAHDPSATGLKYQVSIGRMARECAVVGANMRVKAGVEGRVILGPAGAPGPLEVPLRYAVVVEGPEPRTIVTKLYRIPVTVEPDRTSAVFTEVDDDLTFPMPKLPADLDSYVIYVGFDPSAEKPPERKPPAKKRRPS